MYFKCFYDADLAQASYMVACQQTGECLVVDPVRDIEPYLQEAGAQRLKVTHVSETHIHADYLSGSRELAQATGAQLLLSAEGGPDWQYTYDDGNQVRVRDSQTFQVGHIRIKVLHTPGHTPEHLSFKVTDRARGELPTLLLSGDFAFVGDVGRPDLLDEAAGGLDTRFEAARQMFASLRDKFLTLPSYVQVWPGHGSGSACGKALGAVPSTTVGYERALSWWGHLVEAGDEAAFTSALLAGQPDAPHYYGRMKSENRDGPALLGHTSPLPELSAGEVSRRLAAGARLIDTRSKEAHQAQAPAHSVNLPDSATFETWAGWLLKPEHELILLAPAHRAEALRRKLWMVGLDQVVAYITAARELPLVKAQLLRADALKQRSDSFIIDVRQTSEREAGALPGSVHLHAGRLAWHLDDLPRNRELVVHCQGGARSAAAASLLRAEGFQVSDLVGGYDAWVSAQPPA